MRHVIGRTIASGARAPALVLALCLGFGSEVPIAGAAAEVTLAATTPTGATTRAAQAGAAQAGAAQSTAAHAATSAAQAAPSAEPVVPAPGVVQELELRDGSRLATARPSCRS